MKRIIDLKSLIRPNIVAMKPYTPIEPTDILSQRSDINADNIIKLDGNENPYGCSEKVQLVLGDFSDYHLYPDPEQRILRKHLQSYVGIDAKYIIAGSGSDEIIDVILRLFVDKGDKVINCIPTFGMYQFSTDICGGQIVNVPRNEDFSINLELVRKSIDLTTKVIFIASPNNPSGNRISESDVLELLNMGPLVVIDEAYIEFCGKSLAPLVPKHPNLIVLRTFSKWAGLAGLRIGYGIVPLDLWGYMMKIKQPYNVNIAAQIAAIASLQDMKHIQSMLQLITKERTNLFNKLSSFDWLELYPSDANFILCHVKNGRAKSLYEDLCKQGIFIRYFDTPTLENYVRISVGKPEHTDRIFAAFKLFEKA